MVASTRTPPESPIDPERLSRYADLIVELGANVQPGQIVSVNAQPEDAELARAVATSAYRRGARFVDIAYHDPYVRRARLEHGPDEAIGFVPSWHRERVLQLGEQRCARIGFAGVPEPGLNDGIDLERAARDTFPFIPEVFRIINDRTTNWVGVCSPTPHWAARVHPDLEPGHALAQLWEQVLYTCRLDEPDPPAAWQRRLDRLQTVHTRLNELRFDAIHFEGPGTDLTLGLLPASTWHSGVSETVDGIPFLGNLPTEEVYTAPDPRRAHGIVTATRPLQLQGGTLVTGLVVRFEGGRATQIEADTGAELLRARCAEDEGASRLGEVALVDREGRVGALETVFYTTLLDENAASHVAFGSAYAETVGAEDRNRINDSAVHIDFMIGADDMTVSGITRDGEHVAVLRSGAWQI